MANEIALAKAAREIARELLELPEGSPYPFGKGRVFFPMSKAPCCAVGHVIQRAGLTGFVKDDDQDYYWNSSIGAVCDVVQAGDALGSSIDRIVNYIVGANDAESDASEVAQWLYVFADALELRAATQTGEG